MNINDINNLIFEDVLDDRSKAEKKLMIIRKEYKRLHSITDLMLNLAAAKDYFNKIEIGDNILVSIKDYLNNRTVQDDEVVFYKNDVEGIYYAAAFTPYLLASQKNALSKSKHLDYLRLGGDLATIKVAYTVLEFNNIDDYCIVKFKKNDFNSFKKNIDKCYTNPLDVYNNLMSRLDFGNNRLSDFTIDKTLAFYIK